MGNHKRIALVISLFLICISPVHAQDLVALERELGKVGFEQVNILPERRNNEEILFRIGLEHRSMNNPLDIILLANFICKKHGIDAPGITLFRKGQVIHESRVQVDGKIVTQNLSDTFTRDFNRSFSLNKYRFNTYLTPDLKVRFGNFINPLQIKANLIWGSEVVLSRGLSVFSGLSIPLVNDLDNQELAFTIAPTYLEYFNQLINGHYLQISAGTFFNNRYGLDYQYKYFDTNKKWSLGLRYAYSGFYFFASNSIYFENFDSQLILLDFEYSFPKQRLSALLQVGQYLNHDQGVRVEFYKQYRNIELGFFSAFTKSGSNAGFKIMVPLIPNRILRNDHFELRTDEAFRWEYSYSNEGLVSGGFKAGTLLSDRLRRYNNNFFNYY